MNVSVSIPTALRRHTDGLDQFACAASSIPELLDQLSVRFPELKPHLRDESGKLRRFLNIYINDEDVRFLGADYHFKDGDEVTLVPSIAGG